MFSVQGLIFSLAFFGKKNLRFCNSLGVILVVIIVVTVQKLTFRNISAITERKRIQPSVGTRMQCSRCTKDLCGVLSFLCINEQRTVKSQYKISDKSVQVNALYVCFRKIHVSCFIVLLYNRIFGNRVKL